MDRRPHSARRPDVAATGLVLAGTPLYVWTFFVIVIGLATLGCPPDAYECPF